MMFLLGLLALVQITFLPGYLLLRLVDVPRGALRTIVLCLALSLTLNSLLVPLLVLLGAYHRPVLLALWLAEAILAVRWAMPTLRQPVAELLSRKAEEVGQFLLARRAQGTAAAAADGAALLLAVVVVHRFIVRATEQWGSIIKGWDALFSWNPWTMSFAAGVLPTVTMHYPQLLPANWSLTYVFMGDANVQFMIQALVPLFPLALLLAILELGLCTKRPGYLLGACATALLFVLLLPDHIDSAEADLPAAFMAFVPVYLLLALADGQGTDRLANHLLLGGIAAAGAAATKQAGLFVLLAYPVGAYGLCRRDARPLDARARRRVVAGVALAYAVVVTPWYIRAEWRIRVGGERSEIPLVAATVVEHHGASRGERLAAGVAAVRNTFARNARDWWQAATGVRPDEFRRVAAGCLFAPLALGALLSLRRREWRLLLLGVVAPMFVYWALLLSYDLRNLAVVLPLVGTAAGVGLADGAARLAAARRGTTRVWAIALAAAVGVLLVARAPWASDRALRQWHTSLERLRGNRAMNEILYDYGRTHGFEGMILSDYSFLGMLPELKDRRRGVSLDRPSEFIAAAEQPEVAYILVSNRRNPRVRESLAYIDEQIRAGRWAELPAAGDGRFVRVLRPAP